MRNTDLSKVLFPVEMRPLQYRDGSGSPVHLRSHQVVIDRDMDAPVGVVGSGYQLILNEEALKFAKDCASQLFETKPSDLEVFNVITPYRRWFCHIDLVHRGYEVNILKNEVYLPFVRVTNSYNATRALRFDVGYCRKLCLNGVIFEKHSIEFNFPHSSRGMSNRVDFQIAKGKLQALRTEFESDAERLHSFQFPQGSAVPLVFRALQLPMPKSPEDWEKRKDDFYLPLKERVEELADRYVGPLGQNAYAILNAGTDFASNPPETPNIRRQTHAMQSRLGQWANEFSEAVTNPSFNLPTYVGDYMAVSGWAE